MAEAFCCSIGSSIAGNVFQRIANRLQDELKYCFRFNNIKNDFEHQQVLIVARQETVKNHVREALNNTETIQRDVEYWMEQVDKLRKELDKFDDERGKLPKGFSPWRRYRISKKMTEITKEMIELFNQGKFEIYSLPTALPSMEYFTPGNFTYFESTKSACKELMKALEQDEMVGLYGMGGSGKTTLVREVARTAMKLEYFDLVCFTVVSQTPDLRSIQGQIADFLSLKLLEESEAGRAARIQLRLQTGGDRVLLILDDVWGKLNLELIGVHQGCKILLTTRLRPTCILMDCQKIIQLGLLSEEESWTFFQQHARIAVGRPSWLSEDMARNIAKECKGLPIAIEAVGTTLREKLLEDWTLALHDLKHSKPMDTDEGVRDAFTCLKLSYDYLRNNKAKSLFLMCGLFPEDHDIYIEDLFRYGMGLGLCEETELEIARSEVKAGINNLIASCLLTHSQKGKDYLKMHDIVRDVSLWIGKKMLGKIVENPNSEALREAYAISSWYKEGNPFPHEFYAPNLEILLLNTRNELNLSYTSFQCVKMLKVIAIINEDHHKKLRVSLPQSAEESLLLPNLKTLRLVGLELHDISFIATLQELEILDLRASQFKELPRGIIQLKKLKLLDLHTCELNEDSCTIAGQLMLKLQELKYVKDPRSI